MPKWVWVRDTSTGHQFDVEASTLPRPGLAEVEGVGPVEGPGALPRPAKPFVGKDGRPAVYRPDTQPATTDEQQGESESASGAQTQVTTPAKPADMKQNRSAR